MWGVASRNAWNVTGAGIKAMRAMGGVRAASFTVQDTADFQKRVLTSKTPIVVDFFATWCNPCRMLTPRIESVIAENEGKVDLAKVDIDQNSDLALDYGVSSVPVLLIIQNGTVVEKLVGLQDTDKLRTWINQALKTKAS